MDLTRDWQHCGQCGSSCFGTCAGGVCDTTSAYVHFIAAVISPGRLVVDSAHVYFAEHGGDARGIYQVPKSGGPTSLVVPLVGNGPLVLAQDPTHLFWRYDGLIGTAAKTGGSAATLAVTSGAPTDTLVVDGSHVYWLEKLPSAGGSEWHVMRVPKSGGTPGTFHTFTTSEFWPGILEQALENIIWLGGSPLPVWLAPKNGGPIVKLPCPGCSNFKVASGTLFAFVPPSGLFGEGEYFALDAYTGSATHLTTGLGGRSVADAGYLYWLDNKQDLGVEDFRIRRASACGAGQVVLYGSNVDLPLAIALDEKFVYWTSTAAWGGGAPPPPSGQLLRAPR